MHRRYIKKENGNVYEVTELDAEGRHRTTVYLGKDPDYIKQEEEEKPKKKTKKPED